MDFYGELIHELKKITEEFREDVRDSFGANIEYEILQEKRNILHKLQNLADDVDTRLRRIDDTLEPHRHI